MVEVKKSHCCESVEASIFREKTAGGEVLKILGRTKVNPWVVGPTV